MCDKISLLSPKIHLLHTLDNPGNVHPTPNTPSPHQMMPKNQNQHATAKATSLEAAKHYITSDHF